MWSLTAKVWSWEFKMWSPESMPLTIRNTSSKHKIDKLEAVPHLGELSPRRTQYGLGRGLPAYQVASWSIQPSGHNRHRPKIGGCAPFLWGSWVLC